MESQINVEEICRLCLRAKVSGMILLEINMDQQNKFQEITNTELIVDSGYPKRCCSECRDQLENFYFYKNQLLRKQNELMQVLKFPVQEQKQTESFISFEETANKEEEKGEIFEEVIEEKQDVDEEEKLELPEEEKLHETKQELVKPPEETNENVIEEEELDLIEEKLELIEENFEEEEEDREENYIEEVVDDIEVSEPVYFAEEINDETAQDEENYFDYLDYEDIEELETDEGSEPPKKVQRLEELKFEKKTPALILSPDYIKTREILKKLPLDYTKMERFDGTKVFVCNNLNCNLELESEEEIKLHMKEHPIMVHDKLICPKCSKAFKTQHFFQKHIENVHGDVEHICQFCGKVLSTKIQLRSHLRNHDTTLKYKCQYEGCGKAFRVKHHLVNHTRGHTNESPFVCNFEGCSASFRQKHALTIHLRKHNGDLIRCEKCNSPFAAKFLLSKHLEKCNGVYRPLKTRAPSKGEKSSSNSVNLYKCSVPDCNEAFKVKVTLEKHLKKFHKIQLTPTTCILCICDFPSPLALRAHICNHLPFSCTICSSRFKTKENYENHMKNHSDNEVRLHQCPECPASFKRSEHLRTHMAYKHITSDQSVDS